MIDKDSIIAVCGATGTVGSTIIQILSDRGYNVRAISRDPAKGTQLPNVTWVKSDLNDVESFANAIRGSEVLFLVTGNFTNMVKYQRNGIKAAKNAGIRKVVKLSALGSSEYSQSLLGLWHSNVERTLIESGLEWVMLRPHVFMQNLTEQKDDIKNGRVYSAADDGIVPFIDSRDISAVAVETLIRDDWNGKKLVLTGGESISFDDVAQSFSNALGIKVEHIKETEDDAWHRLRNMGLPIWLAAGQMALFEYWRNGGTTARVSDTVEKILNRKPYSIDDFTRDYKDTFSN